MNERKKKIGFIKQLRKDNFNNYTKRNKANSYLSPQLIEDTTTYDFIHLLLFSI